MSDDEAVMARRGGHEALDIFVARLFVDVDAELSELDPDVSVQSRGLDFIERADVFVAPRLARKATRGI